MIMWCPKYNVNGSYYGLCLPFPKKKEKGKVVSISERTCK